MQYRFKEFIRSTMFDLGRLRCWLMTAGVRSLIVLGPASNVPAAFPANGHSADFVTCR